MRKVEPKESETKENLEELEEDGRPPKAWWDKCTAKVRSGKPDYTEEQVAAVCGNIWFNKPEQRGIGESEEEQLPVEEPVEEPVVEPEEKAEEIAETVGDIIEAEIPEASTEQIQKVEDKTEDLTDKILKEEPVEPTATVAELQEALDKISNTLKELRENLDKKVEEAIKEERQKIAKKLEEALMTGFIESKWKLSARKFAIDIRKIKKELEE